MKKHITQKIDGGKLVRVDFEITDEKIKEIKITGDFFIHPEESIFLIEDSLKGVQVNEIAFKIKEVVESTGTKIIGFSPQDVQDIVSSSQDTSN